MDKRPFPAYQGDEPYVFVSYAHADAARVYPMLSYLHEQGVHIWYDEGIEPGSKWREELASAIQNADRVLFIASKKSVASPNCERELDYALSHNIPVRVVYIEKAELSPALSFSLGSHQGIFQSHYDEAAFQEKLFDLVTKEPKKILGVIPTGRRSRAGVLLGAAAIIGASVVYYATTREGPVDESVTRAAIDITPTLEEPVRIAIRPLSNITGEDDVGWVGEGLAKLLRDQLSASRYAVVLSPIAWRSIAEEGASEAAIAENARAAGVDYLVSGEMLGEEETLLATMRVTNLRAGIDVMAQTYPDLTPQELVNSSTRIATNIKQAMKIPREEGLQSLSADFVTDNLGAYEAFIEGLERNVNFDYPEAERALRAALTLDPEFHIARYRLADVLYISSKRTEARAEIEKIPEEAALDEREKAYIKGLKQALYDDFDGAIATYSALLEKYPYEVEAQQRLARVYFDAYQETKSIEVLTALRRQEPENPYVLGALGYQLMSVNELDKAEEVLGDYLARHPELPNAWHLNAALKLRRVNVDAAQEEFEKAISLDSNFTDSKIGLGKTLALKGALDEAIAQFRPIRDASELLPRYRIDAAFALADLHRAKETPGAMEALLTPVEDLIRAEGVRVGLFWYTRAQAQLDLGETEKALAHLETAKREDTGGLPTRFVHMEGVIKAQRGEDAAAEIEVLRANRLPDDNPDRTEDKAIAHIEGIAAMQAGNTDEAVTKLQQAVEQFGYEYGIYKIELAKALFADGKRRDAMKVIDEARSQHNNLLSGDLRLDLLYHQHRAGHVMVDFHEQMGDDNAARALREALHEGRE